MQNTIFRAVSYIDSLHKTLHRLEPYENNEYSSINHIYTDSDIIVYNYTIHSVCLKVVQHECVTF